MVVKRDMVDCSRQDLWRVTGCVVINNAWTTGANLQLRGWGEDSVGEVTVRKAWGPGFGSLEPTSKLGMTAHASNPAQGLER